MSNLCSVTFQYLSFIIFDPFIDLFITLCIVVNTLFMALDHHDMDPGMNDTLKNGNYVSPADVDMKLFLNEQCPASFTFFNSKYGYYNILLMTEFKPLIYGIGSERSAN